MSGLSASTITSSLASHGTDAATQALIVQFLNNVGSAAALAGTEHQAGPVFDDPTSGSGVQSRGYDIGLTVAQRIVTQRANLGGFSSLAQLAHIKGFGADKFNDLIYSFTRVVHELTAIEFNWNNATRSNDSMNLRRSFAAAAPSPSWLKGVSVNAADSIALYGIADTSGRPLAIRAALRANGLSAAFVRATGGGALGPVAEQLVSFDAAGASGWQTFALPAPTFHAGGVGRHDIEWRWQWRARSTDAWRDLRATRHRIYVTLAAPTLPWVQVAGSTALPWADALDIACVWAAGATTGDAAAALVTQRYNGCGVVAYDTVSGATFYGWGSYNLTQMLNRLNGGPGLGAKVNCTDSANTVSTLANLLGCDLWQSRMQSGFALNPMIAIGFNTWAVPFNGSFSYHEVAWKGGCTQFDNVFDGCLKVDGDADPTSAPHTPLLATNLLFGDCATLNYRLRLCPPGPSGCGNCVPAPATTRQRRALL